MNYSTQCRAARWSASSLCAYFDEEDASICEAYVSPKERDVVSECMKWNVVGILPLIFLLSPLLSRIFYTSYLLFVLLFFFYCLLVFLLPNLSFLKDPDTNLEEHIKIDLRETGRRGVDWNGQHKIPASQKSLEFLDKLNKYKLSMEILHRGIGTSRLALKYLYNKRSYLIYLFIRQ